MIKIITTTHAPQIAKKLMRSSIEDKADFFRLLGKEFEKMSPEDQEADIVGIGPILSPEAKRYLLSIIENI